VSGKNRRKNRKKEKKKSNATRGRRATTGTSGEKKELKKGEKKKIGKDGRRGQKRGRLLETGLGPEVHRREDGREKKKRRGHGKGKPCGTTKTRVPAVETGRLEQSLGGREVTKKTHKKVGNRWTFLKGVDLSKQE